MSNGGIHPKTLSPPLLAYGLELEMEHYPVKRSLLP